MRTKLFLLLTIIFYSYKIEAQDYIDYFQKINTAESLIGSSEYEKAYAIYDKLIKTYPNCFYKDIHNACLCAIKLEKYEEALSLACDLVKHGYKLKDFESQGFDGLRSQKKYWNEFLSEYPRLQSQYEKSLNLPLRNKFQALYEVDQRVASIRNNTRMGDSVFYKLAISLSTLIKEAGFPCWMQNQDTINIHFYIMLRHYCGLKNKINNSEEMQQDSLYAGMTNNDIPILIEQALHEGLITPDWYENASTYWDNSNPYGKLAIVIDFNIEKVYPALQADTSKIPEINYRREKTGLPPITGVLSDSLLNPTWYKFYPFREVRQTLLSCDTCNSMNDFIMMIPSIERKVKKEYSQKKRNDFILKDWSEIQDKHYMGLYQFIKDKIKEEKKDL